MITSLYLENFQKFFSKKLVFDRVTTLIGDTDTGKSSILRALGWLCLNNLRGEGFIKRGKKEARVRAKIDGKKVFRQKRQGQNTYRLDGQVFQAVASNIPNEVASFLSLSQENFQEQIEAPFWFNLSPGMVSRELNSIINLDQIDSTLETIASWLRQANQDKTSTERRLQEAKEKTESLAWVVQAKEDQGKILTQEKRIAFIRAKRDCLESLLEKTRELASFQQNAKQMILDATKLKALLEKRKEQEERKENLTSLLEEIHKEVNKVCQLTGQEEKLRAKVTGLQKGKCPVCKKKW